MWTRPQLKAEGKAAFKRNYWRAVLVGILLSLSLGGTTSWRVNTEGGEETTSMDALTAQKERLEGMLELVSINGNVVRDGEGQLFHHTHALFSFKQKIGSDAAASAHPDGRQTVAGGHLKATTVLYTAEIELRPTVGGAIRRKYDPETGTGFWDF